ncbi:MAG: Mrp/NBP35 family ATP-binding protein [Clostridia bacterium]|nr:Mrp/NBP35 family ATP-binding protein [Clostridia bacterium]
MSENEKNGGAECTTEDCSSCGLDCPSRKAESESLIEPINKLSRVKRVIAVVSGKGGVGKSTVTSLLAVAMRRRGYSVSVLDADVTGPSIPRAFGIAAGGAEGDKYGIIPTSTETGIKVMSVNMLLDDETTPVVWRGALISSVVKQFWTDVIWGENDYMFIDMPPGTGDVPLTVFQSIPLDGIIVVTTPQELVSVIVAKAVNMANMMNIPIVGVIENMSYLVCPDCGRKIELFGDGEAAKEEIESMGLELIGRLPVSPDITSLVDCGRIEAVPYDCLSEAAEKIKI